MSGNNVTREQIMKALSMEPVRQKTKLEIWTSIYNEQLDWLLRNQVDVKMFTKLSKKYKKDASIETILSNLRESQILVEKKQIIVDFIAREMRRLKKKAQSGKKKNGNEN